MTTNNELPRVEDPSKILYNSVIEKLNAIHQTNNSEDSSFSHPLSMPCIYKVSKELRKLNKSAYNPCVVSIGPIHYSNDDDDDKEEQHLKEMEHIKVAYTGELLCRIAGKSASPEVKRYWMDKALMECSAAMLLLEASALNCYAENLKPIIEKKIPQHRLAEMLLIDGCFILELLYRSFLVERRNRIPQGDQLFRDSMIMSGIRHDLLLLENQVPFFILEVLFSKTIKAIPDLPSSSCPSLTQFVLSFFGNVMNLNNDYIESTTINLEEEKCFHILHLIHSCCLPSSPNHAPDHPIHALDHPPKHRASDLDFAGVKFVDGTGVNFKEASGLLSWCDRAKFEIPPLSIYDFTEPLLRNLIAFEQYCPSLKCRGITSYAFLMVSLIDSAADVELLEKAGIINNYLGSSEEAKVLLNNICEHAVLGEFHFAKPCNDAESYCSRRWQRFRSRMNRDYFSNPWSSISVFAAFILFSLSVVQTVYTLLAYYGVEYGTERELYHMHSVL